MKEQVVKDAKEAAAADKENKALKATAEAEINKLMSLKDRLKETKNRLASHCSWYLD